MFKRARTCVYIAVTFAEGIVGYFAVRFHCGIFTEFYLFYKIFCEIEFINLPLSQAREYERLHLELLQSVTQHVVCGASDEENLEISLSLRSTLLNRVACNAPIGRPGPTCYRLTRRRGCGRWSRRALWRAMMMTAAGYSG